MAEDGGHRLAGDGCVLEEGANLVEQALLGADELRRVTG
jgi:hypothetical protein